MIDANKTCDTCAHIKTSLYDEPCRTCSASLSRGLPSSKWEPRNQAQQDEVNAQLRAVMDSMVVGTGVIKTENVDPKAYFTVPEMNEWADRIVNKTSGMKFDGGKRDFTLLPWAAVEEIVKVLEFGARKYERDNWKKVEDAQHRYTKAAFRHLIAYNNREINDPESGLPHLAHLGCCILFLLALEKIE